MQKRYATLKAFKRHFLSSETLFRIKHISRLVFVNVVLILSVAVISTGLVIVLSFFLNSETILTTQFYETTDLQVRPNSPFRVDIEDLQFSTNGSVSAGRWLLSYSNETGAFYSSSRLNETLEAVSWVDEDSGRSFSLYNVINDSKVFVGDGRISIVTTRPAYSKPYPTRHYFPIDTYGFTVKIVFDGTHGYLKLLEEDIGFSVGLDDSTW